MESDDSEEFTLRNLQGDDAMLTLFIKRARARARRTICVMKVKQTTRGLTVYINAALAYVTSRYYKARGR